MLSRSNRTKALMALLLMMQQQISVAAFHASLPNRAAMLMNRGTRNTLNDDIIIVLRAVSSDEAVERMRQQKLDREAMEAEQLPMLFDDEMIDEMNAAYMTLEKRIQEGPGSLTSSEINQLEARFKYIIGEMKSNEHKRHQKPQLKSKEQTGGATVVVAPPQTTDPFRQEQSQQRAEMQSSASSVPRINPVIVDTSQDEAPDYDGAGGMGQPRGTVNTYTIPGMEEMSSEEYMQALTDRVVETARERRRTGRAGNQATWSYLSSLTGQTEGVLKRKNGILNDDEDEN